MAASKEFIVKMMNHAIEQFIYFDNNALKYIEELKSAEKVFDYKWALKNYDRCIDVRNDWAREIYVYMSILGPDVVDLTEVHEREMRKD